jgi:hypothetical protein
MKRTMKALFLAAVVALPMFVTGCVYAPAHPYYGRSWAPGYWSGPRGDAWVPGHWR